MMAKVSSLRPSHQDGIAAVVGVAVVTADGTPKLIARALCPACTDHEGGLGVSHLQQDGALVCCRCNATRVKPTKGMRHFELGTDSEKCKSKRGGKQRSAHTMGLCRFRDSSAAGVANTAHWRQDGDLAVAVLKSLLIGWAICARRHRGTVSSLRYRDTEPQVCHAELGGYVVEASWQCEDDLERNRAHWGGGQSVAKPRLPMLSLASARFNRKVRRRHGVVAFVPSRERS